MGVSCRDTDEDVDEDDELQKLEDTGFMMVNNNNNNKHNERLTVTVDVIYLSGAIFYGHIRPHPFMKRSLL